MITWWDWPTFFIIVFRVSWFISLDSLLDIFQNPAIPHPPGRTILVIIFYPLFSFINIDKSITYQSWNLWPRLTHSYFLIHDFSKCVTGTFSLVIGDDAVHNFCLLDIEYEQFKSDIWTGTWIGVGFERKHFFCLYMCYVQYICTLLLIKMILINHMQNS